jgi:hypothetical protein
MQALFIKDTLFFKGSVQRKLRWVENGVNRCVWTWDCGAGCFFVILLCHLLVCTIFLFLVSIAQFIGEFWKNGWSATSNVALRLLRCYTASLLPALKGEAGPLRRANRRSAVNLQRQLEVFTDFFYSLRFAYWRRTNCGTNSIGTA